MSDQPKAFLMRRYVYPGRGANEWWKVEDGGVICVYFNASIRKTMTFPYDIERDRAKSWVEIGVWHKDMTGGRAMRELGYEPVEERED